MEHLNNTQCHVCGKHQRIGGLMPGELVRKSLSDLIQKECPNWSSEKCICISCLNEIRKNYIEDILEKDKGELTLLEEQVMKSMQEHEVIAKNINVEFESKLTLGQKMADNVARYAGSWRFIICFFLILIVWVVLNIVVLVAKPFDPFPFILLNLVLTCIAATQAPIIMMSQNRSESKDRMRAEHDYIVNLKAELEIRNLHEKLDHLLVNQWQRLLEIQKIQMDLMEEIAVKQKKSKEAPENQ
ncbi:MAG: DUF1003 domain-containing protein [Chloroflexi bacterium]|nr:DUF1003 domain-containing protein [Chloroflexota bacterium]